MRKIIVVLLFAVVICGCQKEKTSNRIKVIDSAYHVRVIEIDDHEYLESSNGYIAHLESCKCKEAR